MKKYLMCLLSLMLVFMSMSPVLAIEKNLFMVRNAKMYDEYNALVSQKNQRLTVEDNMYQVIAEDPNSFLIEPNATKDINNFKNIILMANGETVKTLIKEDVTENLNTIIVIDKKSDTKLYYEWEKNDEHVLLIVNDVKYIIRETFDLVELVSENNDKLVLSKTYYDRKELLKTDETVPSVRASNLRDYAYSSSDDSAYSADHGPLKTTNKAILQIFDAISLVTGGLSIKGTHPVLGTISFICAATSMAANRWIGTFYIRFWQAYQLNTIGGLTRNKERWFSESSCENKYFVKNKTSYFNATRPGY